MESKGEILKKKLQCDDDDDVTQRMMNDRDCSQITANQPYLPNTKTNTNNNKWASSGTEVQVQSKALQLRLQHHHHQSERKRGILNLQGGKVRGKRANTNVNCLKFRCKACWNPRRRQNSCGRVGGSLICQKWGDILENDHEVKSICNPAAGCLESVEIEVKIEKRHPGKLTKWRIMNQVATKRAAEEWLNFLSWMTLRILCTLFSVDAIWISVGPFHETFVFSVSN